MLRPLLQPAELPLQRRLPLLPQRHDEDLDMLRWQSALPAALRVRRVQRRLELLERRALVLLGVLDGTRQQLLKRRQTGGVETMLASPLLLLFAAAGFAQLFSL